MRTFLSDSKGNVAIIFALSAIPIFGAMGAALDYSMASAYRADLQKSLDATALALTKIMPANQETLDNAAKTYFYANLGENNLQNLQLTVTPDIGTLRVSASATYRVKMAHIIGAEKIDISAASEAKWSMGKVEIALVLDMSLSMQTPDPARINALRGATTDLLNVLESAARNEGDAKIGIVPFDGMVNVGYTHATAPGWIKWDWWDANAYDSIGDRCRYPNASGGTTAINFTPGNLPAGTQLKQYCEQQNGPSYCQGASGSSQNQCQSRGGKWITPRGVWTSLPRNQWTGCVYDRNQNHDVNDTAPSGASTNYPAAKCYGAAPQAITPLSEDWDALRTKATNLTPTGYTNITIGLTWGWHVLSPTDLYTEGAAYGTDDLTKYVILMTDGYNTKNVALEPTACNTNGPVCPVVDARTRLACENIKTAGIKIYTIRLIAGNADLLRDCASSPAMYYDVQNAGQLSGVFSAIGSEIASLHLSR